MTEPRDLPRVSDEEFAEELAKVRGEGHILIERLLLDLRDAMAETDTLRARLAELEENTVAIEGKGIRWAEVDLEMNYTGPCVAEKLRRANVVVEAALRERDQWIDTCEQTGNKMHAEHHRAEAAEARLARLREVVGHQADLMEGIGEHALAIAEDTIGEDVPWGKSPEFRVAMQRLFRSIGNQIATDLRAALAETVSAVPQEPDLGDVNAYPDADTTRKSVPPAATPPERTCMNEQWNGQDISDAMPCDCPQCRIEPPAGTPPPLSDEEREARKPAPPHIALDRLHGTVHKEPPALPQEPTP